MKTLIVEDDFTSRLLLQEILKEHGPAHIAVDGNEAVSAVETALTGDAPYDLICLDIMMPGMDGQEALCRIRKAEAEAGFRPGEGARVVMVTALADSDNVTAAFREQCDAYLVKPIDKAGMSATLRELGVLP